MQLSEPGGPFPKAVLPAHDKKAKGLIWIVSIIIFLVIASLSRIRVNVSLGFDPHIFALVNALVNSLVVLSLVAALIAVKTKHYLLHKKIMLTAIVLSVIFLLSYIAHHLLTGDTRFGDLNHDGILSEVERQQAGGLRYFYYILLLTHIPLAAVILPFILFTAYRALSGNYFAHKRLARITWPIWLYVAITGVIIYLLVKPYY